MLVKNCVGALPRHETSCANPAFHQLVPLAALACVLLIELIDVVIADLGFGANSVHFLCAHSRTVEASPVDDAVRRLIKQL